MDRLNMRVPVEMAQKYNDVWRGYVDFHWIYTTKNGSVELSAYDNLIDKPLNIHQIPCPTYGQVLEYLKNKGYGIRTGAMNVLKNDEVWYNTMNKHIHFQMSKILK